LVTQVFRQVLATAGGEADQGLPISPTKTKKIMPTMSEQTQKTGEGEGREREGGRGRGKKEGRDRETPIQTCLL